MERRKFLIGTGALASGSAAAVGTGAFTSVSANRDVNVQTAGDAGAFLQLTPSDGPNSAYAEQSDDTLTVNFNGEAQNDDANPTGSGLNEDASIIIRDVFDITNNGTEDVFVWIEGADGTPLGVFSDDTAGNENGSTAMGPNNPEAAPELPPVNVAADHRVDVGNTQGAIGFSIDTSGGLDSTYELTVVAKAVSEFPDGDTVPENPE